MQVIRVFSWLVNTPQINYYSNCATSATRLLRCFRKCALQSFLFPNRAGKLLVNSASSFKASGVSPLDNHGRVVAKSCAPGPGARERTVARRGGAGVAAHDLRGAGAGGAGGRGRGPGAPGDDQPSGRRTFPSVLKSWFSSVLRARPA